MKKEDVANLMMLMLKDQAKVLGMVMEEIESTRTTAMGCRRALSGWDALDDSPENMAKQLKTAVKVNARQAETIEKLLVVLLVYVMGDSYSGDAANALMRLGRGGDALKEMWDQKLSGK